jgi:hypothetical protein
VSTPASRFKRGRSSRAQEARLSAALRDGPSDAELDAALAQLADAPLPVGFVARTVERATGWPRFRIQARDLWLPVATGLGTAAAVGAVIGAAGGAGPLWLRRLALWLLTAWSDLSPLPPPSAAALLLISSAGMMLLTAAIVLAATPSGGVE